MKQFRAYVSKAQEGILSENPASGGFDRVPFLSETRERSAGETLQASLRAEEMREENTRENQGTALTGEREISLSGTGREGERTDEPPLPENNLSEGKSSSRGSLFSRRAILLAILVNVALGLLLALVMHLDRPEPPRYVYYIELSDRPKDASKRMESGLEHQSAPEEASSQPKGQ